MIGRSMRWMGLAVLALLLAGCVAVTPAGVVFTISPIVDYRVPAPEVVEALEEIAEEQGVPVEQACIDPNTADSDTLQLLIHVGPVRAGAIEALRERIVFETPDDLALISGINAARVEQIRAQGLVCGA